MASNWKTNAVPQTQIVIANGSIGASYTVAGAFTSPIIYLIFSSTIDGAIQISFDGVNDHLPILKGSTTPQVVPINFKAAYADLPNPIIAVKKIDTLSAGSLYISAFTAQFP